MITSAYAPKDKFHLGGVDEVACLARRLAAAGDNDGKVRVELPDGTLLEGELHDYFRANKRALMGRALDLSAAYRQLPVHPESLKHAVIACFDPGAAPARLFLANALPFGATASAYSFSRCSRSLWWIGARLLKLFWTNYIDDYPQVEPAETVGSAATLSEALMRCLGRVVSTNKLRPFASSFVALGVEFCFDDVARGAFTVKHRPGRVAELAGLIADLQGGVALSRPVAASVAGKFAFLCSQFFSKIGLLPLSVLHRYAAGGDRSVSPEDAVAAAAELLCACQLAPSRELRVSSPSPPTLLFTDGAVEGEAFSHATVGAILFLPDGSTHFFIEGGPQGWVAGWQSDGVK